MSQLEQAPTDDATLPERLRPEEDPWSALAVNQDDVLGDGGIPSPVVGVVDDASAAITEEDAEIVTDEDDEEETDEPEALAEPAYEGELDTDEAGAVMTMVDPAVAPTRGGAFTIPMVCAGIAIIACCLLIPQADANRRLAWQHLKLKSDLEAVEKQVSVNEEFLLKVSDDPNLAERLAQRQMKIIRPGTKVLELKDSGEAEMSPFQITAVAPPPKLAPYQPRGGTLAQLCYNPKSRLYLLGAGLLLTAVGLVLGIGPRSAD